MKQVIFLLFLFKGVLFSQDVKTEIININKAYYRNTNVAMSIVSKAYTDRTDKPVSESRLEVYKTSDKFLFRTLASESMSNGDYKINLDNKKKLIIINRVTNPTEHKKSGLKLFEENDYHLLMDTVLSYYKEVKLRQKDNKQNEIEFIFKSGMYESITITYDKKTFLVYDYHIKVKSRSEKGRNQLYTYVITNSYYEGSTLKKQLFNVRNYVVIKKGMILPSTKYSGYKVIDNINKKSNNL
jgi:hypothetical protein